MSPTVREDSLGEEDLPLEGALGCVCDNSSPLFLWHQDSLPACRPGGEKKGRKKGGVTDVTKEVGGQQEGNISHSDLIRERRRATIYSKRVRQQEGVGALVSSVVSKLHLFRGIIHCVPGQSILLLLLVYYSWHAETLFQHMFVQM